jgi:hypothetical protein
MSELNRAPDEAMRGETSDRRSAPAWCRSAGQGLRPHHSAARKCDHAPEAQRPTAATPATTSTTVIVMRNEYSIRELPELSRHLRNSVPRHLITSSRVVPNMTKNGLSAKKKPWRYRVRSHCVKIGERQNLTVRTFAHPFPPRALCTTRDGKLSRASYSA